jgi:integrase
MATVEERGNSTRVNWRLGGTRDGARQSCTFQGTPTARRKLANAAKAVVESRRHNMTRTECYAAVLGQEPVDADSIVPTVKMWVATYLELREKARDIQPDTLDRYKQILETRVVPRLGHLRLTDITEDDIRDWIAWMSSLRATKGSKNRVATGRLLSAQTVRRAHSVLHTCLGAAVPRWIPRNPAARPAGARKHSTGLPKIAPFDGIFLTPAESNMVLEHCDEDIHDLVYTDLHTGIRLGEIVALQVQHVVRQRKGMVVRVRRALKDDGSIGAPKSAKSIRDLPVSNAVGRMLLKRIAGKRPTDLVFPSPRGKVWDENNLRERHWLPAVAAAQRCAEHPPPEPPKPTRGPRRRLRNDEVSTCRCETRLTCRPRLHDLRHTHASLLIHAGWTPKKIQHRLGHASFVVTMNIYGHLWDLGDEQELEALERMLAPEAPSPHRGRSGSVARRGRRVAVRRLLSRR